MTQGPPPQEPKKRIYLDSSRRPSKLTQELIVQVCDLLEQGMPMDGVCDFLGIAPQTFWTWLRKGTLYLQDPEIQPKYRLYGDFILNTRRSAAAYRLHLLNRLHTGSNWSREMSILERRDRKNFSRFDPYGYGTYEQLDPDEKFA